MVINHLLNGMILQVVSHPLLINPLIPTNRLGRAMAQLGPSVQFKSWESKVPPPQSYPPQEIRP